VIAILGGLGAAFLWSAATLASARASRLIGASSTVAWAMLIGLFIALPGALLAGPLPPITGTTVVWLAFSGFGNVAGLLLVYRGLKIGKIGVVSALASTEGAVAAAIAILGGEQLTLGVGAMLVVIAFGVATVALAAPHAPEEQPSRRAVDPAAARRAALFGAASAVAFGLGLYGSGQVGMALPIAIAVLPPRVVGTVAVFLPMVLTGHLRLRREALPFVALIGLVEVVGTASFALGARQSIAIAAVLASQFAAISAIAAFLLYRERLSVRQRSGVVAIALGVAALTALRG